MSTFVLVHGLGAGGWVWRQVAERLRSDGHTVFTPTHTGLGARSHLASPAVNLDTHIADVANVLHWEQLEDVVLVGHSYGGAVITGVADRVPDRLRHMVYLDAFILRKGESIMSLEPPDRVAIYEARVRDQGDGWLLNPNPPEFYGVTDPAISAWLDELQTPQPFGTFTQPISISDVEPACPRTYVWANDFPDGPFGKFADRVRHDPDWTFHELSGGHMLQNTNPEGVVEILLALT